MGLVYHCERCKNEQRPYDDVWEEPQPCRKCLEAEVERLQADYNAAWDAMRAAHGCYDDSLTLAEKITVVVKAGREKQTIVEKLPKTADSVPVVPGMTLWPTGIDMQYGPRPVRDGCPFANIGLRQCYSTREKAEKATKGEH